MNDVLPQATEIAQYRFLIALDDSIRPLLDPAEIMQTAAAILGRHLGVNRCAYADVDADRGVFNLTGDYTDGVPSIIGRYTSADFGAEFVRSHTEGRPYIVEDAEADPRVADVLESYRQTQIRAVISVPIIKAGRFVAGMAVHQNMPRRWQAHEVQLLSLVASRCWESIERNRIARELLHTERQALNASRQAENQHRMLDALLDAIPAGIVMSDVTGKILRVNAANKRLWGYDFPMSENVSQHHGWNGWWADGSASHGRQLEPHEWTMARVLRGETISRDIVEIEPFHEPGVRRTVVCTGGAIRDERGNIVSGVVVQIDITDQVKAETALRESEAKFRTIANAMPQMVWSTLPDGFHDYFNRQWYDYTGVPEGATDGEGWNGMFHPEDQTQAWNAWRHSLKTGQLYEIQYRLRHRSGQYRWVLGRALPVHDDAGRIIRWMGTCTDIHDQKLAEEELKIANRRKDEFLAMLAHELRNPLAPISTAAQLLKIASSDEKRVRQSSDIIARQVRHMTTLVDDLLDVSRVTRGLVELDKADTDIKSVVASAIEQARPLIEARKHELVTRIPSAHAYVHADRTRLVQVIANLLNNAAKYTPQGGEITLSIEVQKTQVKIHVVDNGIGIDPALLPQVFDLFTQAERTPDRSQGGLGLGLALVKSTMTLHGGRVEAYSAGVGKGSVFTIAMPLTRKEEREQRDAENSSPACASGKPLRMMIVDDNADAAQSLAALLESEGHHVTVKADAQSALETAFAEHQQVFILDIGLPDIDGYELARQLRAQTATAESLLIALTGYGQAHDKVLARAAGFDHHFVKPIDMQQLAGVLARIQ